MITILLVEDDSEVRDICSRHLALAGYDILTARDGLQAVASAHKHRPDLILMDMGLPLMDGWQATQQLKTEHITKSIPIIALTAYVMDEDYARCLDAGCDEYEVKPVEFPRLFAKIERLLHN